ncbi:MULTISPECIES: dynamin family protein [unclassified Diaminobutyricimonas]|uniref:dynamin family protein n=1 Tax=unclassified Diaminobutyricimonas TaxID=2643261 RepID=UPI0012F4B273|nr:MULTISPECIES: dynamin family protein [unclassified Diaminobutyricimonas]
MTTATPIQVAGLVADALEVYRDDPTARTRLNAFAERLTQPLRVAIAGMVKAGKSTLLNAIIGEEIAPSDTGECTKIVTWYRYSETPRVTLFPTVGEPRGLPVKRVDGRLSFDIGQTKAEDVKRLVVDWPVQSLRGLTLIDTPGIASLSEDVSARTTDFLTPEDTASEADAIVYVMRHLHSADLGFLTSFRDAVAGDSGTVNAIGVLSRADEIGAGRIDSLISARDIAERYRRDDSLRELVLGVLPMAGLLAQSARTLRQSEFNALAEVAALDRDERERLMISTDRFTRATDVTLSPEVRATLLSRFGMFGIRMASSLIRNGFTEPTELAHELARRSGLGELTRQLSGLFQARAEQLKARAALIGVQKLIRERPHPGTDALAAEIERIFAGAHEYRELQVLAVARTTGLPLARDLADDAERLVGGRGVSAAERLGLAPDASVEEVRSEALAQVHHWRALAYSPLIDRAGAKVCQVVERSCEAILAETRSSPLVTVTVPISPEPAPGTRHEAGEESRNR